MRISSARADIFRSVRATSGPSFNYSIFCPIRVSSVTHDPVSAQVRFFNALIGARRETSQVVASRESVPTIVAQIRDAGDSELRLELRRGKEVPCKRISIPWHKPANRSLQLVADWSPRRFAALIRPPACALLSAARR